MKMKTVRTSHELDMEEWAKKNPLTAIALKATKAEVLEYLEEKYGKDI